MPEPAFVTTTLLLERLRDNRDEDAWQQFDSRFRGVLISTGLRLGLIRDDAEEAAQETMMQAFRDYRQGKYDRSRGRLSSWIVAIAHHRIVDLRRKRGRADGSAMARAKDDGVREPEVAEAFELALERHIFEEAWRFVQEQGKFAPPTLAAFELTAMRSVPAAEAGRQCGLSVDQVYVARNRVSKRLQEIVENLSQSVRDGL